MIRVSIDLDSAVSRSRSARHATIVISNTGGTATRGTYSYKIYGKKDRLLHKGEITDFPRKTGLALDLVGLVLMDARGEKWLKY